MAESGTKVRQLLEPFWAAGVSYFKYWLDPQKNYESCDAFVTRKTKEYRAKYDAGQISEPQATTYFMMLKEAAKHVVGYNDGCTSIVAREMESFKASILAKR